MILFSHAIAGAAAANLFPDNPAAGLAAAFLSHYLIDTIPHRDYEIEHFFDEDPKTAKKAFRNMTAKFKFFASVTLDAVLGVFLSLVLFVRDERSLYLTIMGIAIAFLPDLFQFLFHKFKKQPWIFFQYIHDAFHHPDKMKNRPVVGTLTQAGTIFLIILFYFLFKG